jgi:hypothetical protein
VDTTALPAGVFAFEFRARDVANVVTSDTARFVVSLVVQHLSRNIVIVAETRNGNGSPGSPHDTTVNAFYERVVGALSPSVPFRTIRYTGDPTRPGQYISPFDLKDAGLVVWHADDRSDIFLNDNLTVLSAFLSKGGRFVLSGYDVLNRFPFITNDTVTFASGFAFDDLRLFAGYRNTARTTEGFKVIPWPGATGLPDSCLIDSTKLRPNFHGILDNCWTFQPRGECVTFGRLAVTSPDSNRFSDRPSCYYYDLSFRVALFGVPLFFCREDQVTPIMQALIPHMMEGLSEPF